MARISSRLIVIAMHRWITRLVGFWLTLFVPSVVGWGVLVRWSDAGPRRFERVWRWCAHLTTLPLIARPLTDRCWIWLDHDGGLLAVLGFGLLVSLWCLMIALPVSVVWVWADWLGRRLDPSRSYAGGGSSSAYDPYALPSTATDSPARNALYLIMIPLALLWHSLRWFLRSFRGAIITFVLVWVFFFVAYVIATYRMNPDQWPTDVLELESAWDGYLSTLGFHHLFGDVWHRNFYLTVLLADRARMDHEVWAQVTSDLTNFPYVLKLYAVFATMHALLAAVVVGSISTLFKVFRHL